jgi:hypothetical protein
MDELNLTDEDMRRILLVVRRFLINEATRPDDLRAALAERLQDSQPALAGKIERMGNFEMARLCQTILTRQQPVA